VAAGPAGLETFAPESFDAISMFHVLEHEQQPLDLLRRVHRILKPGGRLLVGVPNAASLARRLFGRHWMGYDFSRHRQVFTPRSLQATLSAAGFESDRLQGRLEDEIIDAEGSAKLLLGSHNIRSPALAIAIALAALSLMAIPRLFGQYSIMYSFAHKA
jgi:SAM-dependent methyltransferase